ncbi:RDD family protein [Hymenobacter sp. BRD128]|uniref:RDD family protein n=1 Tax=Hymenobacter sp. BRD128 TaxID=2675878 RepID=UPI001567B1AC|nr:RDD family protein [Hymenobacter sp. BRD128]QKG57480.1 RDD family protein [Hymenobacter sp. BRD128]
MATIRVHTTQNVTLAYEVASVGDRVAASLLDYLLYGVWAMLVAMVADKLHSGWLIWYLILLPTVFYHLACEIFFNGQSIGKKARDIRVMRLDGTPARLGDYFLRWLLRPLEILLTLGSVAAVTILLNGKGQRLGDLLAGTTVLSMRPRARRLLLPEDAVPAGYQPVFGQAAQLSDRDVALLRQLLSRSLKQENFLVLHETALKVKHLLEVHSDLNDEAFLRTVLRDHAYLAAVAQ